MSKENIMAGVQYDVDSIGGGGFGGFGGNNPLLWLITLGFLGRDFGSLGNNSNAGAGVLAGETQGKLDCLQQGQSALSSQISENSQQTQFQSLLDVINGVSVTARDSRDAITGLINDFRSEAAECCCENRIGFESIRTALQMQTNDLLTAGTANTQRIVDLLTSQSIEFKNDRISELERQAQTAQLIAAIQSTCGGNFNGGGNNIDINVLAAALARNVPATSGN